MSIHKRAYMIEVGYAEQIYGYHHFTYARDLSWAFIDNFPLQDQYNQRSTNLAVITPSNYGYGYAGFKEVYIDPVLRLKRNGTWIKVPHVWGSPTSNNPFYRDGWRWLCIEGGDKSLLKFLKQVSCFLGIQ